MKRLFVLFVSIHTLSVFAQKFSVRVIADTNAIRIGEQFKITLSAKGPIGTRFAFPNLNDTITSHFEVIKVLKTDTVLSANRDSITLNQTYVVTSFDSGYWPIPPLKVFVLPDTTHCLESEAILITVNTLPVDTTQEIRDIKAPFNVPISWQEWLPYVLAGLAVLAATFAGWYVYRKIKSKKKALPQPPVKTPAEIALERLDELLKKQLWQSSRYKDYFSELTDIIKSYFDSKYNLNTQEQITIDTIKILRSYLNPDDLEKLKRVLTLADLVKFAKEIPLSNQCENSFNDIKEIIQNTSVVVGESDAA